MHTLKIDLSAAVRTCYEYSFRRGKINKSARVNTRNNIAKLDAELELELELGPVQEILETRELKNEADGIEQ